MPASRSNEALFSVFDSDSSVSFQLEKQDKSLTKLDKEKQFPAAGNKTMLISVTDHTDLGTAEAEIDVDKLDIPDPDNKYDEADKLPVTDDNDVSGKVINVSLNLRNDKRQYRKPCISTIFFAISFCSVQFSIIIYMDTMMPIAHTNDPLGP